MKHTITNVGRSTQIVYTARRHPVSVAPGTTITADLDDNTASRVSVSRFLRLDGGGEQEQFDPVTRETEKVEIREEETRETLLAKYEAKEISYLELTKRARAVLGDEMPDGVPKKSVLVALLRRES